MTNLPKKYLRKNEIIRLSMPIVVKNRIDSLIEIFDLVDKYEKELKSNLFNIIREELPHLRVSNSLHRFFYIELYSYYDYVKKMISDEKIIIEFPSYINNGKLKKLRNSFAHPEKNFNDIVKAINNFEDDENTGFDNLVSDFYIFNNEFQKLLIDVGKKKIIKKMDQDNKKEGIDL